MTPTTVLARLDDRLGIEARQVASADVYRTIQKGQQNQSATGLQPTAQQYSAYSQMFQHFNRELFASRLPQPMLTFSRRKMAYGLFIPEAWIGRDGEPIHEIALNPDQLSERTALEVASTLVHEICHEWQQLFGKPSRSGYHNKEFAEIMEARGLWTTSNGRMDGRRTGQKITHVILEGGAFERSFARMPEEVYLPFICQRRSPQLKQPRDRSKTKYTCPATGKSFWAPPGVVAIDFTTGEPFINTDDPDDTSNRIDDTTLKLIKWVLSLSEESKRQLLNLVTAAETARSGVASPIAASTGRRCEASRKQPPEHESPRPTRLSVAGSVR